MRPLELARRYMEIVFGGENPEMLRPLCAETFSFSGPFYRYDTAESYIDSLKSDPPVGFQYTLLKEFADDSSACLLFLFRKPGVQTPMAQFFEIKEGKISKILLIFDTRPFLKSTE
ncbi:MAG: hypothetical protein Kow0042_30160 [Calditrichia bacterium]